MRLFLLIKLVENVSILLYRYGLALPRTMRMEV